jgi:ergothioneine biosynthesis protein EgtB
MGLTPFHPEFDRLFAFGIDPLDGQFPRDQPGDWPPLTQVETYRNRVRERLDASLSNTPETEELSESLNIAIEHRLMHAETLEYMFHQLPYSVKTRPQTSVLIREERPVTSSMIAIPAGDVTLGLRRGGGEFGWDNEFEAQVVDVPAFSVDKHKVTNRQFLRFVEDGGYNTQALWSPADWAWRVKEDISRPIFWVPGKDRFSYRSMFQEISLPLDASVFVSHAEALAYARWVGKTLPTEAQWQRAAQGAHPPPDARQLWDPPSIGVSLGAPSDFGVEGLIGTGWEWTSTEFAPFPGFRSHPGYPGYSADFFDDKHFVMKGGSTRTAACLLRRSFRNWFQPHYQYGYAGLRCVAK